MHSLLPRLCLALFACFATVACEEEGPEGDDTTDAASGTEADETAGTTGAATAGVTMGTIAMPPGEDSEGDDSTTGDEDDTGTDTKGPATTLGPPKFD